MGSGVVRYVCVSSSKGTAKKAVQRAVLKTGHGVEDDAHAGPWHRQVSLLDERDIESMRAKGLELSPGDFGENLVVAGVDLGDLGIGSQLRVGEAVLEVTQIGKVCHDRCEIYQRVGDCIMPRAGVFTRVLEGGEVGPGTSIEVTAMVPRSTVQAAVLTVSDRCSAGRMEDTSGPALVESLERELQAHVAWTGVVPDDAGAITDALRDIAGRGVDLLLTTGGTGCGPRDVTPEATRAVITREVPGLSEAMRSASAQKTPHALLQRGVCGIAGSTLILNLPGSKRGAVENLAAVLPALPHAVQLLRGDTEHRGTEV